MGYLFVTESSAKVSFEENTFSVKKKDGAITKIPAETLESISFFGNPQMTTQCMQQCMKRGIPVSFYSKGGQYFGRLESTGHVNVERQRRQCELFHKPFALEFSKKIVRAKIHNQIVVLDRYGRSRQMNVQEATQNMKILERKVFTCTSIDQIMGYEGAAARYYFSTLGRLVESDFRFEKRSRRPPKDAFNSMLSLGYSMLMNEIYGKLENRGLNPYFGFMHQDREKHPTLASDLMEEWRAVIVDAVVMNLINGHEIKIEQFSYDTYGNGVFLNRDAMKIFINKMEKRMGTDNSYLKHIEYRVSFRRSLELQIDSLIHAMQEEDMDLYQPVRIR